MSPAQLLRCEDLRDQAVSLYSNGDLCIYWTQKQTNIILNEDYFFIAKKIFHLLTKTFSSWSAAVSESDTAKLACKANSGAEIK